MKQIITGILFCATTALTAQTTLVPGKNVFQKKFIRTETYQMQWFALKDTMRIELGEVLTEIKKENKNVTIVTEVKMRNSKASWADTTIARLSTLEPVRHSSYNSQRDMVLNFGKVVTGFYNDKMKQQYYSISDTVSLPYFDSNLYPALIAWLPLKEGYANDISIYDHNPSGKKGVIKAFIRNVSSGIYQTTNAGTRNVWIVTVDDEISNTNSHIIYYIDKTDRKLWKQEINSAGRKMVMLRKEF